VPESWSLSVPLLDAERNLESMSMYRFESERGFARVSMRLFHCLTYAYVYERDRTSEGRGLYEVHLSCLFPILFLGGRVKKRRFRFVIV
jgi:hypothetical protein